MEVRTKRRLRAMHNGQKRSDGMPPAFAANTRCLTCTNPGAVSAHSEASIRRSGARMKVKATFKIFVARERSYTKRASLL